MDFNKAYCFYKDDISSLVNALVKSTNNYRVEIDDLIQEANIKLWQLSTQNPLIYNKSRVLIAIKNHLLDCIRRCRKDAIYEAKSFEELNSQND